MVYTPTNRRPAPGAIPTRPTRPRRIPRPAVRGFGQATTATELTGAGGQIATSVTSMLAQAGDVAASAVPIVGVAAEVATMLAQYIGHGCGSACTDAAQAEQIYEAATDNLFAVFKAGMITEDQFIAGATAFLNAGQQHMATFNTKQAANGAANMQKVIGQMLSTIGSFSPLPAPAPLDLNQAHTLYLTGASGWYAASLAAASQLTDAYLQSIPADQLPYVTVGGVPGATTGTSAAGTVAALTDTTILGLPLWIWAAGVAVLLLTR